MKVKSFMQQVKIYIISTLFILGLLVSPTISFEEKVDIALKFESGVSVKKDISKGTFYSIIYISKTDSKTNLDFILSDHRFGSSKLDNSNPEENFSSFSYKNNSNKYNYYINRSDNSYVLAKSIHQLKSIRV